MALRCCFAAATATHYKKTPECIHVPGVIFYNLFGELQAQLRNVAVLSFLSFTEK